MAMEHGPFSSDFPNETSIHRGFSIAMFDYQMVISFFDDLQERLPSLELGSSEWITVEVQDYPKHDLPSV